jgi:hypothetical protein
MTVSHPRTKSGSATSDQRPARRARRPWHIAVLGVVAVGLGLIVPAIAQAVPTHATTAKASAPNANWTARVSNAYGYNLLAGPHLRPLSRYEFMGSLHNSGKLGYCIEYAKRLGPEQPWQQVPAGTVAWQQIAYTVNAWGNTTSRTQAAAVNDALNRLSGNRNYALDRPGYVAQLNRIDRRVVPLSNLYVQQAQLYHGPYRASMRATPVQVGQQGQAVFTVIAATGRGVPGALVRLAYSGATGPAGGRAAANGTLTVRFTRTSTSPVTITGTGYQLGQSSLLFISRPPAGYQRLVAVSTVPRVSVSARTTFQLGVSGPTVQVDCNTNCEGHPPVTLTFTNAAGAATTQYYPVRGGVADTRYSVVLAGGQRGSLSFIGTHREGVGWAYRVYYGGRWGDIIVVTNRLFIVDCPPLPTLHFEGECFCIGKTATFSIPTNTTRDAQAIYINGQRVRIASPGQSASVRVTLTGKTVAGVGSQKLNGQWLVKTFITITP